MGTRTGRVKINVGGKIFETTATTLAIVRNSFFGALLDDNWNHLPHNPGDVQEYFIDRNPDYFSVLLDLLITGELYIPPNISEMLLYREAQFYGLLDRVKSAKWGPLDGHHLRLSRSVTVDQAVGDATAIRASPEGGCCVAHGSMVRVYDWKLEEQPSINLDYRLVKDACWIDSDSILVSTGCGMALFGATTGKVRHRFEVTHQGKLTKIYKAGASSFSSDHNRIFASCERKIEYGPYEYEIGVWDRVTGEQIDIFNKDIRGLAKRLQWLNGTNCLMVLCSPSVGGVGLWDLRQNRMVLSYGSCIADAIAIEENNCLCVVDGSYRENVNVQFLDLRGKGNMTTLGRPRKLATKLDEPYQKKLAFHEGHIFVSMKDNISVFSGPDLVHTSMLRRSRDGVSICDISIGGGRLFALHGEEPIFDIWESKAPLII